MAYLENTLLLEHLFTLVLLISKEKRLFSVLSGLCKEDDHIFTSGIVTFYQSATKESDQTGCVNRKVLCFSLNIKRTRINKYSSKIAF